MSFNFTHANSSPPTPQQQQQQQSQSSDRPSLRTPYVAPSSSSSFPTHLPGHMSALSHDSLSSLALRGPEAEVFRSIQLQQDNDGDISSSGWPSMAVQDTHKAHDFTRHYAPTHTQKPSTSSPLPVTVDRSKSDVTSGVLSDSHVFPSAPPSIPGGYLEPNSHFYVTALPAIPPQTIYSAIMNMVKSMHCSKLRCVDCVECPSKYKLCCTAYAQCGSSTPFIVRLFTHHANKPSQQKQYVVELQKRSGDMQLFYEIFHSIQQQLSHQYPQLQVTSCNSHIPPFGQVPCQAGNSPTGLAMPQPIRSFSAPPLSTAHTTAGNALGGDMLCETIKSLLEMCASPCQDIKVQALVALAELTVQGRLDQKISNGCKENIRKVLIEEGCWKFFVECLISQFEEVSRTALSALANLCEGKECCTKLCKDEQMMSNLYKLTTSSQTPQVVREAARMLQNLACQLGGQLVEDISPHHRAALASTLNQLSKVSDSQCYQSVQAFKSALGHEGCRMLEAQ